MQALLSSIALFVFLMPASAAGPVQARAAMRAAAETKEITIDNFTFKTPELTVAAGTVVTWVNRDDMPHTVVGARKEFASPVLDTDQRFSFTFTTPGTYEYYCSIHPRMTGRVIVR